LGVGGLKMNREEKIANRVADRLADDPTGRLKTEYVKNIWKLQDSLDNAIVELSNEINKVKGLRFEPKEISVYEQKFVTLSLELKEKLKDMQRVLDKEHNKFEKLNA
jgi:hypothetical protein